MCGLWGILNYRNNGFSHGAKEAITPMMLLTSMRGAHSTGMFGVSLKKEKEKVVDKLSVVRKVGSPYNLLLESDTKKFMERAWRDMHAVIGHGRFATKGDITAQNAHPFYKDNIVLVHNGGINNLHEFKIDGIRVEDLVEVDSHACALLLNTMEPKEFFSKIRGAFAFIWYDRRTHSVYACRNTERPLYIMIREDVPEVLFASEPSTLEYVKSKYNMTASDPLDITPENLYTFPLGEASKPEYAKEKVKFYTWTSNYSGGGRRGRYNSAAGWDRYDYMGTDPYTSGRAHYHTPTLPPATVPNTHVYDQSRALYVPRGNAAQPVEPPKNGEPRIKKADLDNYTFRKDDYIAFWPGEIELINKQEHDLEKQVYVVRGYSQPSDRVVIAYHAMGLELANRIHKEVLVAGKINAIYYIKEGESTDNSIMRLYLKDIVFLTDDEVEAQMKKSDPNPADLLKIIEAHQKMDETNGKMMFLTLKNGDQISLHRFNTLAAKGCARCGQAIEVTDAVGVLNASDVPSATEKEQRHGGFYCPDCVLRSVSH